MARVQADIDEGDRLGITGTPASFINGIPINGAQEVSVYSRIIEAELAAAGSTKTVPTVSSEAASPESGSTVDQGKLG